MVKKKIGVKKTMAKGVGKSQIGAAKGIQLSDVNRHSKTKKVAAEGTGSTKKKKKP